MPATGALPSSLLRVGSTPLIELTERFPDLGRGIRLCAKAEWHNPGGSVKDRAGLSIIQEAEHSGALTKAKILLDATSGNTGIAYAWLCARLGYRLTLAVPRSINPQRRAIMQAYGAELVMTDPQEGSDGAIRHARVLQAADPKKYYYADQYNNSANWRAHYNATAPEIFAQTEGALTHFVAGLGTSGTFVGAGRRLRELNPQIRLISVEPAEALHGLEGLKHMDSAIVPGIYDRSIAHERLAIPTEDGQKICRLLAAKHGLLVGPSGGANIAGALRVARRLADEGKPGLIVTILADSGERYLSDRFWAE